MNAGKFVEESARLWIVDLDQLEMPVSQIRRNQNIG